MDISREGFLDTRQNSLKVGADGAGDNRDTDKEVPTLMVGPKEVVMADLDLA